MSHSLVVQYALWVCFSATVWALELWQSLLPWSSALSQPIRSSKIPHTPPALRKRNVQFIYKNKTLQKANTADMRVDIQSDLNVLVTTFLLDFNCGISYANTIPTGPSHSSIKLKLYNSHVKLKVLSRQNFERKVMNSITDESKHPPLATNRENKPLPTNIKSVWTPLSNSQMDRHAGSVLL